MVTSARAKAEALFSATRRTGRRVQEGDETAGLGVADRVAKLKALRLAKEAADKEKENDG